MKRREFLKKGLAAGGAALVGVHPKPGRAATEAPEARTVPAATAEAPGGFYTHNRAPLQPTAFQKLPIGAITPHGWLRHQLELQAEGLNGRMPEVSDYLVYAGNGWVTPGSHTGWEEVPYWLRGFGDLGYVLGDQRVITLATQWINGVIASQQADGWFGPANLRTSLDGGPDMWPQMPMLEALRSFYEYTHDPRVLTFMTRYFGFQKGVAATNPGQFNKSWAGVRWGNNLDSILWLYNRTGDGSLLDLATTIHTHSANYVTDIPTWHNVNLAQGFREPAEYGMIAKDPKYLAATNHVYETVMGMYGQFSGGGFAGDENCRVGYHDPRQGFETCGVVELMQSFEIMTLLTGDPIWSDRCEELAHNTLPAALDPRQKGTHYLTSANSVTLSAQETHHKQFDDSPMVLQAYKPGVHSYRCCPHNYGMGWPYYAENLWLGTADKGLCASLYAPSEVQAKVGDGTTVHMVQETEYPFDDVITMTLSAPKPVAFPLYLRVPGWCDNPTVKVNGRALSVHAGPQSYLIVQRTWHSGDVVTLHLPMRTVVKTWEKNNNSVSVNHGPLTFALLIDEDWHQYAGTTQWPQYEVKPTSSWNYGLVLDRAAPARSFDVVRKGGVVAPQPWTRQASPIELRAKARKIPQWQADADHVVDLLQPSPAKSSEPLETVTLIPMGAARLRISSFPQIGDGPDAHEWVTPPVAYIAPAGITFSFSHIGGSDAPLAFGNPAVPTSSYDQALSRFTWWPQQGTQEWVEYDFATARTLKASDVYWYDDTGHGACRVPASWSLQWWDGNAWNPVQPTGPYETATNAFNHVAFAPITTTKVRLTAQLQPHFSGGLLSWRLS